MDDEDGGTIFCGNVGFKVSEAILYELFLQAGPIEFLRMPKMNNAHRGFAFVKYKHECAVQYAIDLFDGTELDGRQLTLRNNSTNKRPHSAGGYEHDTQRRNAPHGMQQPLLMLPPHQPSRSYNEQPHYNAAQHYNAQPQSRHHNNWRGTPYHRRHDSDRRHDDGKHSDRHSSRRHRDRRH